jgi:hypothetical protein
MPHVVMLSHDGESDDVRLTFDGSHAAGYRKRVLCPLRVVLVGSPDVCASSEAEQLLTSGKLPLFFPESISYDAWSQDMIAPPARPRRLRNHRECLKRTLDGEGLTLTFRLFARQLVNDGRIWYDKFLGSRSKLPEVFVHAARNSTSAGDISRELSSYFKSKIIFDQEEFW